MPEQIIDNATDTNDTLETLTNAELIAHILERYHVRHRQQLAELNEMAARVETVHSDHPECPHGLSEHLQTMKAELEQHMFKEENILFPMLEKDMGAMAHGPISVMRHEHDEHGEAIARLSTLTNQCQAPDDACNTWARLYELARELVEDLQNHIAIENDILFTRM